jgi:ribosomal protein S12
MVVQLARFLGDGGTGKRQYTAEAKSYSVVVKKPVCNVILNSSPRNRSVIYARITTQPEPNLNAAWVSPAMRKCGRMRSTTPHISTTTYLPRRLQNEVLYR